jgi:hypothetical protein
MDLGPKLDVAKGMGHQWQMPMETNARAWEIGGAYGVEGVM